MDPPAWYRRLVKLSKRREIEEDDFDDDISELHEGEDPDEFYDDESMRRCDCASSDMEDCECDDEDAAPEKKINDGAESEQSYQGSAYYYKLKERRIERKLDLRDQREQQEAERAVHRKLNSEKEQEVREAYDAMLKEQKKADAPRPRLASLARKIFHLFSVDHVDYCYCYNLYLGTQYVEFYYCHDEKGRKITPEEAGGKIQGHVYLNSSAGYDFLPFVQPKRAGVKKRQFSVYEQDHEPVFQFISDKYLIMTVRSDSKIVSRDIEDLGVTDVPKELKFYGICMEKEERKRYQEGVSQRFRHLR
ncbi:hypothetical protein V8C44DRAFT_139573 [Trichoderma aethiopicum]